MIIQKKLKNKKERTKDNNNTQSNKHKETEIEEKGLYQLQEMKRVKEKT